MRVFFLILGTLFLASACLSASQAPNISYLVGTFLPCLFCLIIGLKLGQTQKLGSCPFAVGEGGKGDQTRAEAFKFHANLGIGFGIVLMFFGSALSQQSEIGFLVGSLISFGGSAWEIWGCVNYVRWKGYSGWFGLIGYLLLPGLVILVCFPNRRKRMLKDQRQEDISQEETLSAEDQIAGYRFLWTLAPLVVLFLSVGSFLLWSRANIDPTEWAPVVRSDAGFQAIMPGTPRVEKQTQKAPSGNVELHKFSVNPKGKKELFMIVSIRFPEEVGEQLGGTEKLLELGRKDVLTASQGQLQSEQRIVSGGYSGLEMVVLPSKGAIVKARIYAQKSQIYQVSVHVPKSRLNSEDVRKFFDSFKPSPAPDSSVVH